MAANLLLGVVTLAAFALLCEFVVFRVVLLPSDVPANFYSNGLVRLQPGAKGVWRIRDEIAAPFSINAQGWNSGAGDYELSPAFSGTGIAIIGDSYVEALQVPSTASLAEVVAGDLLDRGRSNRVYRFGISGAPLSQYVLMLERAALHYRPDWVVVLLIHNDFDESFRFHPGRYTSAFLKLRVKHGRVLGEVMPEPYVRTWRDSLRQTATARYLYFRQQITPDRIVKGLTSVLSAVEPTVANASAAADTTAGTPRFQANVDTIRIEREWADVQAATSYLFDRLHRLTMAGSSRLLLVIDGDRQAIYRGTSQDSKALDLNRMAQQLANQKGIDFLDLHGHFADAWQKDHEHFEFRSDNHWNAAGHAVAGRAIAEFIAASH
ncbi:MAG: SGNH/GDSL hydrolase family protein [Thiohalocapsa sp.]